MMLQTAKNAEADPQTVLVPLTVSEIAMIRAALQVTARTVPGTGMERDLKTLHGLFLGLPGIRGIVKRSKGNQATK